MKQTIGRRVHVRMALIVSSSWSTEIAGSFNDSLKDVETVDGVSGGERVPTGEE